MKVNASEFVNGGFPPDEGKRLAEIMLAMSDLAWPELQVDVSDCAPTLLISAFFNGFLQEVYDQRRDLLPHAKRINWGLQFDFQRENVDRWMSDFKPYEA